MFKEICNIAWRIFCWPTFHQFVKYGITGSTTVLIDMVILYILTDFFGFWYMSSATISTTTAVVFNFLINRNWSFRSNGYMRRQMTKYLLLLGFNYLYSIFGLYFLVEVFGIYYLIAKVIIAMTMVSWNFALFRYVIYK
jgi:putative flippase GtrA